MESDVSDGHTIPNGKTLKDSINKKKSERERFPQIRTAAHMSRRSNVMFADSFKSGLCLFSRMPACHFLQRQRKVTICDLVQSASGLNVVLVVPHVMPSLTAHSTASA